MLAFCFIVHLALPHLSTVTFHDLVAGLSVHDLQNSLGDNGANGVGVSIRLSVRRSERERTGALSHSPCLPDGDMWKSLRKFDYNLLGKWCGSCVELFH